jgi:hypothetical protein
MATLLASKGKRLSSLLFTRFDTAQMSRSPLAFFIMFCLVVLFFASYMLPGNMYEGLGAYGALAVVPVTFAAFVWERKGGIFSKLLIIIGLAFMNCLEIGFHWPMSLI